MFTEKENRKSHLQLFVWGIPSSRVICRVERCVWGWFSWLCTRSPTALTFSVVRVVRGRPLPGARLMDPVVRNRFWKSSTPRLLHFLFENSLINLFTPYFFDSQTFLSMSCLLLLTFFRFRFRFRFIRIVARRLKITKFTANKKH